MTVAADGTPGWERALKWARRRPVAAVALLLLLAAVLSTCLVGWALDERARAVRAEGQAQEQLVQAVQARRQRDRALRAEEAAKRSHADTKAVLSFFQDHVLSARRPQGYPGGQGKDVSLRQAVDVAEGAIAGAFRDRPLVEASIRDTLGTTYRYLGEADLAAGQHRRALALYTARLGSDDPVTLACGNNLAAAYLAAGRTAEALRLFWWTLERREATFGPDDHSTLTSRNDLAAAYRAAGRTAEAIRLLERALQRMDASLDPNNPLTMIARNNLATTYLSAGRTAEAIRLLERTLAQREARLGPDHPGTLTSRNNLARAYWSAGRTAEAIRLLERTLERMEARFGPGHPDTMTTLEALIQWYQRLGRFAQARPLAARYLQLRLAKLPAQIAADDWRLAERGELYAYAGRWPQAAADLAAAVRAQPQRFMLWFLGAPLFLEVHGPKAYHGHCRGMLHCYGAATNPVIAGRAAKACLLAPAAAGDLALAVRLAERAVTGTQKHALYPHFQLARGLAHYRAGEFEAAIARLRPCLAGQEWNLTVPAQLVLAMAQHRLGHAEQARDALGRARAIMAGKQFPPGEQGDLIYVWHDWLICQHLRREAEALIGAPK
jgi:tetratricopeptide (TPR) repeat protein